MVRSGKWSLSHSTNTEKNVNRTISLLNHGSTNVMYMYISQPNITHALCSMLWFDFSVETIQGSSVVLPFFALEYVVGHRKFSGFDSISVLAVRHISLVCSLRVATF